MLRRSQIRAARLVLRVWGWYCAALIGAAEGSRARAEFERAWDEAVKAALAALDERLGSHNPTTASAGR